ncbi:DUF4142 domain-containing protein [Dactylosporangium darangshiense]|uniref:DUF4142 domain-containing protein n=1 Tax=Dactylosporangium darangshiense TaxID=579108 RepID=A0ABP8D9N0_9ACTN
MRLPMLAVVALSSMAVGGVPAAAAPAQLSARDAAFVAAAGYGGSFEVAGGELARTRAESPDVREFGGRMVSDHTKAGARLAALVKPLGVSVPDRPNAAQQNIIMNWSRLDGRAFDCSYVPAEYLDHVGAVGLFANEAAHGDNADLVRFARETLPTLEDHEEMITAALAVLDCSQ